MERFGLADNEMFLRDFKHRKSYSSIDDIVDLLNRVDESDNCAVDLIKKELAEQEDENVTRVLMNILNSLNIKGHPMIVNKNKVKEREAELIHYVGFLPMDILKYIDGLKRNDYLKSINKYEEIQKLNHKYRVIYSKQGQSYRKNVLKKWIADNPKFSDCVIIL